MAALPTIFELATAHAETSGMVRCCFRSDDPAVDADGLAIDPAAVRAGEEGDGGYVVGLAQPFSGASFASRSTTSWGLQLRNRSVAVGPGATALTVMFLPRSSLTRTPVIASTAALVAA